MTNGVDANGRLIAFVYPGRHPLADGSRVELDEAMVDESVNARLVAAGAVHPAFYETVPAGLCDHLATTSRRARLTTPSLGIWGRSTADPDGAATVVDRASLEQLVVWPKLFRRLVSYLGSGVDDFDGLDPWLRADPIHRDDGVATA
jgi:hypothetical protein